MNKQAIVVITLVVFIGALFFLSRDEDSEEQTAATANIQTAAEANHDEYDIVITRTSNGYVPSEVRIQKGHTVLWVNESDNFHWPASNIHPTHRIYSEFDPLGPVGPEEIWSFTFTQTGEWRYHDHLRANKTGVVTVVESED